MADSITASTIVRKAYRGRRESERVILTADNMSCRSTGDGGLIVELFRYGDRGEALEGYQFRFSPEDRATLREKA